MWGPLVLSCARTTVGSPVSMAQDIQKVLSTAAQDILAEAKARRGVRWELGPASCLSGD